jgi:YbgC/YbaW family acyl-CoA thioester hydrolase
METPSVPPDPALSFRARLRTRWSGEDNQSVLNNAVYLTLFEEARHAYFSALGLLAENRFPFLLLQTNARFLAPGRGGVEVEVALATTRLGKSSFTQVYRVREAESGTAWCEAEALCVCHDPEHGGSRAMPPAFREAVRAFERFP